MASGTLQTTDLGAALGSTIIYDSDADSTIQAAKTSAGTVYGIYIDNTANSSAVYLKIFDIAAGSVSLGTSTPTVIVKAPGGLTTATVVMANPGFAFATAVSYVVVTTGGTAGSTDPTNAVPIRLVIA